MVSYPEFRDFIKWAGEQTRASLPVSMQISICRMHIDNVQCIRRELHPTEFRMMLKDFRKLEAMNREL